MTTRKHNRPINTPNEWSIPEPSTGTVDDEDEPEDEHENENEIPVGAPSEDTEAPEEFENIDESREPADPAVDP
jgi:hypothetical protein